MKQFNLQRQVAKAYSYYPQIDRRPIIGITGNYAELTCRLGEGYYKKVVSAGAVPIIIPPLSDAEAILSTLDQIDGLLLSGGADINPLFMGEEPLPQLGGINAERDQPELLLTRLAFNRQLPILGICRGIQTLAVALGGKVQQHIGTNVAEGLTPLKHSQEADRSVPTHTVVIEKDSALYRIYKGRGVAVRSAGGGARIAVNSFHHQAVAAPGPHFRVVAKAPDGVVEAIESSEEKPIIGVQWHPECMGADGQPLFDWLASEADLYRRVQRLHRVTLTLDSHCDTPMFFPQGADFSQRDDRLLVDLSKMTEGRLDAAIMVAYLPQPTAHPRQFADDIFDRIEAIVDRNSSRLALARSHTELFKNKLFGRKSIMLGIENGIALDGQLQNLAHFAERGIVYMTLCHNGDNDICDSARGQQTHGGVSPFGQQVIAEMNRLGVMVDLSHAHEKSFYDALDISTQPIVCSHSSARALCNHPRNLTDDQMRALARKGGVCQITLYPGFLVEGAQKVSEATILDALAHLEHAIKVMGIEHVGLGSDFDGDGGVRGLANASEMILFTRQLLARRYSKDDIQAIWGENFLRVMDKVQKVKKKKK